MRKNISWDYIHYFKEEEIECRCGCGSNDISFRLMLVLDSIRCIIREPVIISSGVRCIKHNKSVGGSETSSHLDGYAVDIKIPDSNYQKKVLDALEELKIGRIGISESFVHICIDPNKEDAIWYY